MIPLKRAAILPPRGHDIVIVEGAQAPGPDLAVLRRRLIAAGRGSKSAQALRQITRSTGRNTNLDEAGAEG